MILNGRSKDGLLFYVTFDYYGSPGLLGSRSFVPYRGFTDLCNCYYHIANSEFLTVSMSYTVSRRQTPADAPSILSNLFVSKQMNRTNHDKRDGIHMKEP